MKMKWNLIGIAALTLTACSPKETASITAVAPAAPAPVVVQPFTGVQFAPPALVPTPAGVVAAPAAPAVQETPAAEAGTGGLSEVQRLTYALQLFYGNSRAPAIHDFEPLVAARLISKVPVAPPGKKYVIDLSRIEVKLVESSQN